MSRRRRRCGGRWSVLVTAVAFLVGGPARRRFVPFEPLPPRPGGLVPPPPNVSAPSWVLFDESSDWLIASHDPDARRPLASTTKMMTALVAAESSSFDELVTVSARRRRGRGGRDRARRRRGASPMGDLVSAILVRSANDAAEAIAEHVGGSVEGFAELMNQKAAEMGLTNSHFVNPHGLDYPGALFVGGRPSADGTGRPGQSATGGHGASRPRSTFRLPPTGRCGEGRRPTACSTRYDGAIGVKTGFTLQASLVLAAAAERDGRRLLAVVMGSEGVGGHFADAAALLDYGFSEARRPCFAARTRWPLLRLEQAARVETLTWLAASGLLGECFRSGHRAPKCSIGSRRNFPGGGKPFRGCPDIGHGFPVNAEPPATEVITASDLADRVDRIGYRHQRGLPESPSDSGGDAGRSPSVPGRPGPTNFGAARCRFLVPVTVRGRRSAAGRA